MWCIFSQLWISHKSHSKAPFMMPACSHPSPCNSQPIIFWISACHSNLTQRPSHLFFCTVCRVMVQCILRSLKYGGRTGDFHHAFWSSCLETTFQLVPQFCFLCFFCFCKCLCMVLNGLKKNNCVFDHVFVKEERGMEADMSWGFEGWMGFCP